ncbi:MAG: 30S ribosomal protein S16 [Planctomycetes bacterium]|jgi:small subunit ribosomal protein S16|nr:30S ribosomal protein S16 [Planctomycetota bacterium]MCC6150570.1 30S ribosomal protein S16 [Planctomycetota bacterium]CAG0971176.1 30S ribosomal protein S16 [Planctomycetaceae bacterium]
MVTLRMTRTGRNKHVTFRLVACDSRSPRDGRHIEILGHYDPHKKEDPKLTFNKERVEHWLGLGAQPSLLVSNLLRKQGINGKTTRELRQKASGKRA